MMTTDPDRITRLEANVDAINGRLDRIEGEISALRSDMNARIDALSARIDSHMRTIIIAGVTAGIGITGLLLGAIVPLYFR